jgi:hypothetical protein
MEGLPLTRRYRLLSAGALLLISSVAFASALKHRPGPVTWIETAGAEATLNTELFVDKDYYAIQALKLWEFDHRTCSLQLEQGSLNAPGSAVLNAIKICEPKLTQDWKRADVGTGQFVTSIATCTSGGKDAGPELHGVELWGSSFTSEGKLKPSKKSVRLVFPKCEKWSQKRSCPAESVAIALRAYSNDPESGAVGLELGCQAIDATP